MYLNITFSFSENRFNVYPLFKIENKKELRFLAGSYSILILKKTPALLSVIVTSTGSVNEIKILKKWSLKKIELIFSNLLIGNITGLDRSVLLKEIARSYSSYLKDGSQQYESGDTSDTGSDAS